MCGIHLSEGSRVQDVGFMEVVRFRVHTVGLREGLGSRVQGVWCRQGSGIEVGTQLDRGVDEGLHIW